MPRSSTDTLATALRILAGQIQSPDDVPAMVFREAADRLGELEQERDDARATMHERTQKLREARRECGHLRQLICDVSQEMDAQGYISPWLLQKLRNVVPCVQRDMSQDAAAALRGGDGNE